MSGLFLGSLTMGKAQVVEAQMVQLGITYGSLGYEMSHNVVVDKLNDDEKKTYPIELTSGVEYVITAVCDGDCGDIDLVMYDDDGNYTIVSDKETDDNPILKYTPRNSAKFLIEVIMPGCDVEPCGYALVIFKK